jgi:hypothetical protein
MHYSKSALIEKPHYLRQQYDKMHYSANSKRSLSFYAWYSCQPLFCAPQPLRCLLESDALISNVDNASHPNQTSDRLGLSDTPSIV